MVEPESIAQVQILQRAVLGVVGVVGVERDLSGSRAKDAQ